MVYAPGSSVIKIADSSSQPAGADGCPGLGRHGSIPKVAICAAVPQLNPPQFGASRQLLFSATMLCPAKSLKTGPANPPHKKNGARDIGGPRPRTKNVFGVVPSIIKPPIITPSPV